MKNTEQKIPALRFPEFSGEWEEKRLGEILSIGNGKDYKHLKEGDVPVYGTGGYMTSVDSFLYEGETVCIGRKGTIDSPMFYSGKIWTVDTLFYTYNFVDALPKFIYNIFQNINWKKYNEASGVPSLSKATIEKLNIFFPSLSEQQKIADFLSAVDTRLQLLKDKKTKLEEYKRGVMQRIFSQELRFTRPDGSAYPNWEEKRLGEIAERITQRNTELNENVLTISAQEGLINQLKYFNNSVAAKNISGYYLLHRDDFAYNKSYSKGYPMGAIKRLNNYPKGIVSTLYICFRNKKEFANSFAEQYFESGIHNRELEKVAQEGARNHGLLNIGVGDFFDTIVLLPCLDEQRQIADFLSAIDDKISLLNQQITSTEQYKKGLLQQMFV